MLTPTELRQGSRQALEKARDASDTAEKRQWAAKGLTLAFQAEHVQRQIAQHWGTSLQGRNEANHLSSAIQFSLLAPYQSIPVSYSGQGARSFAAPARVPPQLGSPSLE